MRQNINAIPEFVHDSAAPSVKLHLTSLRQQKCETKSSGVTRNHLKFFKVLVMRLQEVSKGWKRGWRNFQVAKYLGRTGRSTEIKHAICIPVASSTIWHACEFGRRLTIGEKIGIRIVATIAFIVVVVVIITLSGTYKLV